MKKEKEIATLRLLAGDTYFNQFFGEDIDQMCENIENDFPIDFGCKFNERAATLEAELRAAKREKRKALEDMVAQFIRHEGAFTPEFYKYCVNAVDMLFIIKCKRQQGISIMPNEVDYLIKIADNFENYVNNKQ